MRKALTVATAAAVMLGFAATAAPASAGDTDVTFTLTGGNLTIATPTAAATLSTGALTVAGTSVSGTLGSTTVKDERGALVQNVTVTMASSAFTNDPDATVANDEYVIPATAATGYSGVATPSGTAVPVATAVGVAIGGSGGSILTMASSGSGGATYDPTVTVAVPAGAIAGTYEGVITQTVA